VSAAPAAPALAPFRVRSYRYQWPADLATSWAFEMETIILGWYILVETGSVLLLTLFASLQYLGTLIAPVFGVLGDRLGHRRVLCAMRAAYTTFAATLMVFALAGALTPLIVFVIATLTGLVRPSDLAMRASLIGEIMPSGQLTGAMSISRTTQDTARIAGALTGAGLVAALGMGPAYIAIASLYATSFALILVTTRMQPARVAAPGSAPPASPWRELREGTAYVWTTPALLGAMGLAFLVNLTAFPMVTGVMPYVAKEVYLTDQKGLGYLVASFAFGALLGSLALTRLGGRVRQGRLMIGACVVWYVMILVLAQMPTAALGSVALMLAGCAQSLSMVPMAAMLLRLSEPGYRGRVMGMRMLAIYGLPLGLMAAGPLLKAWGYPATATLYAALGLVFTAWIAVRWREHLWRADAPANAR